MKISRRHLMGMGVALPLMPLVSVQAQTPAATAVSGERLSPLDTGAVLVAGISPDGTTLVGVEDRHTIVFLAADTLEEISRSSMDPVVGALDPTTIAWSPDSSRIAFGLDTWVLMRESDIFVVPVETGLVMNLTGEGSYDEAQPLFGGEDESGIENMTIDVFPSWIDDATVIFGRHRQIGGEFHAELAKLDVDSLEVTTWVEFEPSQIAYVIGPIAVLADGRFGFWSNDANAENGIAIVDADGSLTLVDAGTDSSVMAWSFGMDGCIVHDPMGYESWYLPYDDAAGKIDVSTMFGLSAGEGFSTLPTFAPDGTTLVGVTSSEQRVLVSDGTSTQEAGKLAGENPAGSAQWAENAVLLSSRSESWLVPL